jgi:hypothetical protein
MDRIDAFFLRERDDAFDVEVSLDGTFSSANQVSFVGLEAVEGETILLRVDRYGAEIEFVGGAKDAYGNFAAIES